MGKQQLVARALLLAATLSIGTAQAGEPTAAKHVKDQGADKGGDKGADVDKNKAHEGHGGGRHGMRELVDELKSGKLKKADLKERLGELKEHRDERAKEHREALKAKFGSALAQPTAHDELEHHAQRLAKLDRAMVLAETEVTKDKDKLKERIQKLIDKENERHDKAMQKLAAPAGAAAAAAPPANPPAAVAVEKAGDK